MTNLECARKGIEAAREAIFSHLDAEMLDEMDWGPDGRSPPEGGAPEWASRILEDLDALEATVEAAAKALDARGAPR